MQREEISELNKKLDKVLDAHIFDQVEVAAIQKAITFTSAFNGDPEALLKMQSIYTSVSGFMTVTGRIAALIAFIVFLWTQWDRFAELVGTFREQRR